MPKLLPSAKAALVQYLRAVLNTEWGQKRLKEIEAEIKARGGDTDAMLREADEKA